MTWTSQRFILILFFFPVVLLAGLALGVHRGDDVFFINGNNSFFLDSFFSLVTTLGEGLLFIPIIVYCLFVQFRFAILSIVVWVGHSAVCQVLKRGFFYDVHRPIAVLDKHALHFVPHVEVHGLYSFPSGHTATIFCAAMLLALIVNKKLPAVVFLGVALLVGYSRIYLLQHFLIDVAGGAVIGVVFTYITWKAFQRETLPGWMNNAFANPWKGVSRQFPRKGNQKPAGI